MDITTLQHDIALVALLKTYGKDKTLCDISRLHTSILKQGLLEHSPFIGNTLLNVYAKTGAIAKAQQLFDELPIRDRVSWNGLITGYSLHGQGETALTCFERMQGDGFAPNVVTFLCVLKSCSSIGVAEKGTKVHAEIVRQQLLGKDAVLGNALIDMYMKCGVLPNAQEVFNELVARDVVSWTTLIAGYAQHGCVEEAFRCFKKMKSEGLSPDPVTFTCILKACSSVEASEKVQGTHAEIVKAGLLRSSAMVGSALVDMYSKGGALAKAHELFEELPEHDVVSWTALIGGYCKHGHGVEAFHCFEEMKREGLSPDIVTFCSILKACGGVGESDKGIRVHAELVREGLLSKFSMLGNSLVDMYGKCGAFTHAEEVFEELPARDIISWTALMAGYAQHGYGEEIFDLCEEMQYAGLSPNPVTLACLFKACGIVGASEKGKSLHAEVARKGLLEKNVVLGNAIVDMYGKCGALAKAQEVFDHIPVPNVVSWNALMTGYCQNGHGHEALTNFEHMKCEGTPPDSVTLACILKSCGSIGAAEKGQTHFEAMSTRYGLFPTFKHHTCVVNLCGRAGHFDKAMAVLKKTPPSDYHAVWFTVLSACKRRGNSCLGSLAFENTLPLEISML